MTVKKRLFWSNILMILVPVFITALIGILCIGILWISFIHGAGLKLHDTEDFERVGMAVCEVLEYQLGKGGDLSSIESLAEHNGMAVSITLGGEEIFRCGAEDPNDGPLLAASKLLSEHAVLSQNGRQLYIAKETAGGKDYTIRLFGGNQSAPSPINLKTAFAMSAILIAFAIFVSVLLTNRFLTRFVFKKIEEPLDILTHGVHELRDGNLDFQIPYKRKDEFLPVCEDFNEMAVRLKESVDQIQRQERSRKELIAGISHDIRSPLTSIQAYVEGLLDGIAQTPEAQKSYLLTIKAKAEDLDHIVSQLFLFSKMELDEYPEHPSRIRLDEKIADLVSASSGEYGRKGLSIETRLVPAVIQADPVQMDRILANILENSLKYKDKENGHIRITLTRAADRCRLSFADDGPGVPDSALPHLFEVFYRSDPSRQNPHNGSGLGLAIVSHAVRRMGGTVAAGPSELGGLEIRIDLPCEEEKV